MRCSVVRDERGQALAFITVSLLGILAILALAIDLGMLYVARGEAQRTADSSSLAGAAAFLEFPRLEAADSATPWAERWANQNYVRNQAVPNTDVRVWVIPDSEKVRVAVRRTNLGLWWAKLFGQLLGEVSAVAAAQAVPASGVTCVWPFAMPDLWEEMTQDTAIVNRLWDVAPNNENWTFDTINADRWKPRNPQLPDDLTATGFGSQWRHQVGSTGPYDVGMQMAVKVQDPQGGVITEPFFYLWRLPGNTGANDAAASIRECQNNNVVELGVPYDIEPGNSLGPIRKAVEDVVAMDSLATWDAVNNVVTGSAWNPWIGSPRIFKAGIFPPTQILPNALGTQQVAMSDFGLFFLEGLLGSGSQAPVVARFLGFANGSAVGGGTTGSLLKILRLVE